MVDRELPAHKNTNSRLTDALKEEFCRTYNRRYKVLEWMKSNEKKICKRCKEKNLDCIHPSPGSTQCTHCRGDGHCSKTLAHKKYQVLELMGINESLFLELREWYDAKADTEEGSDAEPGERDTVKEKSVKATKSTPREIKVGGKASGASIRAGSKRVSSGGAKLSGPGSTKRRTLAGSSRNTRNTESEGEDESEKDERQLYPTVSSKYSLKKKLDCERTSPDRDVKQSNSSSDRTQRMATKVSGVGTNFSGACGTKRRTLAGSSHNPTTNTVSEDDDDSEKDGRESYPAVSTNYSSKRKIDCERTSPDRDVKDKPSPNKKCRQSDCDGSDLEVSQLLEDDILDSPLASPSTGNYATHKPSSSGFLNQVNQSAGVPRHGLLTSPTAAKQSKWRPKSLSVVPETASERDTSVNGADATDNAMPRRKMAHSPRVARPTGVPLSSSGSFRPSTTAGVTRLRCIKRAFEDVTTEIRYERSDLRTCVDRLETTLSELGGVIAEMEG
ncbi:hypothetical protein VNI00_018843 [Paramarasmius palmivorus]|uniref:Zn(2)-C6 fungal-type domain-containing protein n=1 Tax=Paramarasmius palmivorus TaxID=297713 RepID=A0AAW0AX46_9AGAR